MPIGEYIHYSYENYVKYGLGKANGEGANGTSGAANATEAY